MESQTLRHEEEIFVSQSKCRPLEAWLRSLIAQHFTQYYQVAAAQALIRENMLEIYNVREIFEKKLRKEDHVVHVAFHALRASNKRKRMSESFWVIFDWPEYGLSAYESHLTKLFLSSGISKLSCKAVLGKSKSISYHYFLILMA